MRKLATIRKIKEVRPIDGADKIELAIIDGWQVVIRKGEFKVGDKVVYLEVDSFLPIKPQYEFLRKSSYKVMADSTEGFRLRTVKLCIPRPSGRSFHGDPATHSTHIRSLNPRLSGHPGR